MGSGSSQHVSSAAIGQHSSAIDTQSMSPPWLAYWTLARLNFGVGGSFLVGSSCLWALTMSAYRNSIPPSTLLLSALLWFSGILIRHSAACVWNDICDVKFDRFVERCKDRPLVSGTVSIPEAIVLSGSLLAVCIAMLCFAGDKSFYLGVFGLFALDIPYPLTKRWTNWPTAWLGVTFAWGAPVVWASANNTMNSPVVPVLFLADFCWTMHFETIYASQDKRDDVKAGVKSTALLFGNYIREICAAFAAVFIACLAYAGILNGQGTGYFLISVLGSALHIIWQFYTLDFDDSAQCGRMFLANSQLGSVIWMGMLVDYFQSVLL